MTHAWSGSLKARGQPIGRRQSSSARGQEAKTAADLLDDERKRISEAIALAESEKQALNRRLDFLLAEADVTEAKRFREEY